MGNKLLYNLVVMPLSWLPFWMLYAISNVLKFFVYNVFGYRKKVVLANMKNSFPQKTEKEIKQLASKFYSHFADLILESVKAFSISEAQLAKRMVSINSELFDKYHQEKKDLILVSGHYGNWEMWASNGQSQMPHATRGVYLPLKNKYWDKKIQESRSKYGMNLVPRKEAVSQLGTSKEPVALLLLVDQSPHVDRKCYWTNFLNQESAVNFGTEKLAITHNTPVIYGNILKVKRGHYEVTWTLVTDTPTEHPHGWITEKITHELEKVINLQPQYWLWTHKRWKRKRRDDEELFNVLRK